MDIHQHLRRKFLVVVDGTPEVKTALHFAARRAHGTGGLVTLLLVLETEKFGHWIGVDHLMKEDARAEAEALLAECCDLVESFGGARPTTHIREGQALTAILGLIEEDPTISTLVLAAGTDPSGPGPLVSLLATSQAGGFHIPVTVIPAELSDAQIDALT